MLMLRMLAWPVLLALTLAATTDFSSADDRTFGGYECTDDCSGHKAGYEWAERKGIKSSSDCPLGNSNSFYEGCLAYTEDPYRGSDADDDGEDID